MVREVMATILARVLAVLFGVVTSVVTARYLGPAGRGEYYLVITVLNLIVGLGIAGLPGTLTYLVARERDDLARLHANALWIAVAMGAVGSLAAHALAGFLPGVSPATLVWLYALAPLAIYIQLCGALLTGVGRVALASWLMVMQGALTVAAMVLAAAVGGELHGFLGATTFGNAGAAIAAMVCVGLLAPLTLRPEARMLLGGEGFAGRSLVVSLLALLLLRINVLLLGSYADQSEVGYYSVAAQLSDVLIILPSAVAASLFPRLMAMPSGRWQATLRSFALFGTLYLAACIAAAACAPLLPYVFGMSFKPSVAIFYWLVPSAFFYGITSIVSQYLAALGLPRSLLAVWAAATALLIVAGLWLIPQGGALGAAQALSLACAFLFVGVFALASLRMARLERTSG
jgi:O-antigen/teichoic acid export membrane protein